MGHLRSRAYPVKSLAWISPGDGAVGIEQYAVKHARRMNAPTLCIYMIHFSSMSIVELESKS